MQKKRRLAMRYSKILKVGFIFGGIRLTNATLGVYYHIAVTLGRVHLGFGFLSLLKQFSVYTYGVLLLCRRCWTQFIDWAAHYPRVLVPRHLWATNKVIRADLIGTRPYFHRECIIWFSVEVCNPLEQIRRDLCSKEMPVCGCSPQTIDFGYEHVCVREGVVTTQSCILEEHQLLSWGHRKSGVDEGGV